MKVSLKGIFFFTCILIIYVSSIDVLLSEPELKDFAPDSENNFVFNPEESETPDSTISIIDSAFVEEENEYIPLSQFMYADNRRYTISGGSALKETKIKPIATIAFGAGLTAVFIAQHIGQKTTIWKETSKFRFIEDIEQDFWVDKYGHAYGAYLVSYILSETLMECGLNHKSATLWGGVLGLSYSTYVEILDGYGLNWGFSPSDFYADIVGAAFFVGQYYYPVLQNFTPKFMYFPADWHGDERRMPNEIFIDDYSSQIFWLSVNVYNLLPESYKKYWFPWLQVSFGYTARNIYDVFHYPELMEKYKPITDVKKEYVWGSPRFIIALDYDLSKILPEGPGLWNWLRQSLNHFKLPSPAIEFSYSKTRYYLVYPFKF